jgi:hypothetical protein
MCAAAFDITSTFNGEAMIASARIRGVLAPVVTPLKLVRSPLARSYPSSLYLDHSHGPVLAPATLAALPSTHAIPDRDVFYVADPISSIQG